VKGVAKPSGPYLQSAEISQGVYHNEYKTITSPDGKSVDVRQVVDAGGQPIDVSTPEGIKQAHTILTQRLEKNRDKVRLAAILLNDKAKLEKFKLKHPEVKKEHLQKWIGEVGEMKALQELLGAGVQAHMLTASAPKNDIVAFIGDQQRGLKMAFYSVKSTKQGEEPNQLGANVRKDVIGYLHDAEKSDIPIEVSGQQYEVNATDYVNMTMDIKSHFFKEMSRGHVGRDGVDVSNMKKSEFLPGFEKTITKLDGKRRGFSEQGDFLKYKKLEEKDINALFDNGDIDQKMIKEYERLGVPVKNYAGTKALLRAQLTEMVRGGNTSLASLTGWMESNMGEAMEKIGANAQPSSDLITFHMNTQTGFDDSSVGIVTAEAQREEFTNKYGDLSKLSGIDKITKIMGLSQRSRGVGNAKNGTGEIDSIDNSKPTVKLIHREIGIPKYVAAIAGRT
jgi:hypothetical protein